MYFFYQTNYKYIYLEPLIKDYDKEMNTKPTCFEAFYLWIKKYLFL